HRLIMILLGHCVMGAIQRKEVIDISVTEFVAVFNRYAIALGVAFYGLFVQLFWCLKAVYSHCRRFASTSGPNQEKQKEALTNLIDFHCIVVRVGDKGSKFYSWFIKALRHAKP